jgi:hypothetical protein
MRTQHVLTFVSAIALVALAASAPTRALAAGQGDNNPDVIEIRHYKLTMDVAQKTAAAMQKINQLIVANPSLNAAIGANNDTQSKPLTQQAQDIDTKYPQIAAVIRANGLATREFLVATGALINDMGWVGMKKGGMVQAYPPGMITPENAALIEGNWEAFQALGAKMSPQESR